MMMMIVLGISPSGLLVKVKLSLCLTKYHAMKTYWGVEVQLHAFLTSAQAGDEWSASRPSSFTSGVKSPRYPLERRLDGPQIPKRPWVLPFHHGDVLFRIRINFCNYESIWIFWKVSLDRGSAQHSTAQHRDVDIHPCLEGIRTHDPSVGAAQACNYCLVCRWWVKLLKVAVAFKLSSCAGCNWWDSWIP
jgi:hypothetical protein